MLTMHNRNLKRMKATVSRLPPLLAIMRIFIYNKMIEGMLFTSCSAVEWIVGIPPVTRTGWQVNMTGFPRLLMCLCLLLHYYYPTELTCCWSRLWEVTFPEARTTWRLARVVHASLVLLTVTGLTKLFATVRASKGFAPCMYPFMNLRSLLGMEAFIAELTPERSLVVMETEVYPQVVWVYHFSTTELTFISEMLSHFSLVIRKCKDQQCWSRLSVGLFGTILFYTQWKLQNKPSYPQMNLFVV